MGESGTGQGGDLLFHPSRQLNILEIITIRNGSGAFIAPLTVLQ